MILVHSYVLSNMGHYKPKRTNFYSFVFHILSGGSSHVTRHTSEKTRSILHVLKCTLRFLTLLSLPNINFQTSISFCESGTQPEYRNRENIILK